METVLASFSHAFDQVLGLPGFNWLRLINTLVNTVTDTQGGSINVKARQAVIETPAQAGPACRQASAASTLAVPASQTVAAILETKTEKE